MTGIGVKKTIGFGMTVLSVSAAGVYYWKSNSAPSVSYREATVVRGDLETSILATGTVQPANRLEIKPPIAGRVEKVLVREGQVVRKGQLLAWMSSTERAALLDAARSQGDDELRKWEDLYRPTPVLAPIHGTVISRNVESGQTFTNTESILVMSDRLTVKAQVDETDIASIKLKQPATIVLDAYSDKKIPARVDQIAYEAKTVNNVTTYTVDVTPARAPEFMRAGMTANVNFLLEAKGGVLLVPTEAVRNSDGKTTVLVRSPSGKQVEKPVEIGISNGKQTEIVQGIEENEVVLAGQVPAVKLKGSRNSSPFGAPRGMGRGR